jgi:hypothetical protein
MRLRCVAAMPALLLPFILYVCLAFVLLLCDLQSQLLCRQGSVLVPMGCEYPVAAGSRGLRLIMVADGLSHTGPLVLFSRCISFFCCFSFQLLI